MHKCRTIGYRGRLTIKLHVDFGLGGGEGSLPLTPVSFKGELYFPITSQVGGLDQNQIQNSNVLNESVSHWKTLCLFNFLSFNKSSKCESPLSLHIPQKNTDTVLFPGRVSKLQAPLIENILKVSGIDYPSVYSHDDLQIVDCL